MDLPAFRLSPNAHRLGLFSAEAGCCASCQQQREWRYTGPFHARQRPDYLCPWCIADGSAAALFAGSFNDWASVEGVNPDPREPSTLDAEQLRELCQRTPGYSSWQQGRWLTHCGQPCAFVGYTDHAEIAALGDELAADTAGMPARYLQAIQRSGTPVAGYLFRCVVCARHRLHTDCG